MPRPIVSGAGFVEKRCPGVKRGPPTPNPHRGHVTTLLEPLTATPEKRYFELGKRSSGTTRDAPADSSTRPPPCSSPQSIHLHYDVLHAFCLREPRSRS